MTAHTVSEYIEALVKSQRLGHHVKAHQYVEGNPALTETIEAAAPKRLHPTLGKMGIRSLYGHQIEAIQSIRKGCHTVVATPTASGKSLIYNLSMVEAVTADARSRGLYIFPLKALTQDQFHAFGQWTKAVLPLEVTAAVYDGDTSAYKRRKIRQAPPHVVMTNPEMLHLALLAYHAQWTEFFSNLKLVVLDEVHTYRGLLGSHMSQLLRRLRRICTLYGSSPTFVFTSATVSNPGELARQLSGAEVATVQQSGTAKGGRHLVIMNPPEGPVQTATLLLKAALARKLRTIVYTQSRKLAELITLWVQQDTGRWSSKISVYRAGLLAEERRDIEGRLKKGSLLAVVSTSALELGIDIGDLDLCILVGYPGSMIATWQRSGRVGRKGQVAGMVMIAGQDALDQYFVSHPDAFFQGRAESAVINPHNPVVLEAHLICAAAEHPIDNDEQWLAEPETAALVDKLEKQGVLLRAAGGATLHARQRRPHLSVDLRSAGQRYRILDDRDRVIGELNGFRLYREAHPGAIYLHQGQTYLAGKVDEAGQSVGVRQVDVDYHTRVRSDTDVEIIEYENKKYIGKTVICNGIVKVTDHITGFEKIDTLSGRKLSRNDLEVPPVVFVTDAIWLEIPSQVCALTRDSGHDLLGALHAAEHAIISIMPLQVLADRNDVGGLATPYHPQNRTASIFVYDGVPGGAGFSRQAFEHPLQLLDTASQAIARCDCDSGCPACVHSPKCGSGNQPMDKAGADFLLRQLIKPGKIVIHKSDSRQLMPKQTAIAAASVDLRYGVFDLETQRSAKAVGGWHMAHQMKVSYGVVYDARDDDFHVYGEGQIDQLLNHLKSLALVVGFNSKRFDYRVLSGYTDFDFKALPSLDLLEVVHRRLGFRLSLDHLAGQTLNAKKTGSGLDALRWWKEGKTDKIIAYCRKDVEITRDLYRFALKKGYLIYRQKNGEKFRIPMPNLQVGYTDKS